MPRHLALGNGSMMVCLDEHAFVRDLYFPYVGLENHVGGSSSHRIGVWVDGTIKWLSDASWHLTVESDDEALAGKTTARNDLLQVELELSDTIYNEKNIFLRRCIVRNLSNEKRTIKVFFAHEFEIYGAHSGDTAYFDPRNNVIVHYNGKRVFAIGGRCNDRPFDDYTTGVFHIEGKEGSYKDAEDGVLSRNPIEHGPTDSVIGFYRSYDPKEEKVHYYWLTAAESVSEARHLSDYTMSKTPEHMIRTTHDFWNAWIKKEHFSFHDLDPRIIKLFKQSLFVIRAHADTHGAIIASGDSDMLQGGKDTYSYMWPRDAAFASMALDMAGDFNSAQRFYRMCNDLISDGGYFMHKYRPDGSLGSSWEPWIRNGEFRLPIQEDETAIALWTLWKHYTLSHDVEFIETIYNSFIKKAADFMVLFRDEHTRLPHPSYDLWEEKYGISTYTASAVYGALTVASKFAALLGKKRSQEYYQNAANEVREAILVHLYDAQTKVFYKMINFEDGKKVIDDTLDMSSIYGLFAFEVLPPTDERLMQAVSQVEQKLASATLVGGIARYAGDKFYRTRKDVPGNPWFITTLWLAQYYIAKAKSPNEFAVVKGWLNWAADHALKSGILSEQLDPYTGQQISAAPLAWSHSEYVITVVKYLDKLESLGLCLECDPLYQHEEVKV
jgi:oligosaccharide amylase